MCVHVCAYVHVQAHAYVCTQVDVYVSTHVYTHFYTDVYTQSIHMSIHISTHMSIHSPYTCPYTCPYTRLYICLYTCLYTCLCTHTHARARARKQRLVYAGPKGAPSIRRHFVAKARECARRILCQFEASYGLPTWESRNSKCLSVVTNIYSLNIVNVLFIHWTQVHVSRCKPSMTFQTNMLQRVIGRSR